MLARVEGIHGHRGVELHRCRDEHGLHIVSRQELPVCSGRGSVGGGSSLVRRLHQVLRRTHAAGVNVTDSGHTDPRHPEGELKQPHAPGANADEAHPQRLGVTRRGEGAHGGERTRGEGRAGGEEHASIQFHRWLPP